MCIGDVSHVGQLWHKCSSRRALHTPLYNTAEQPRAAAEREREPPSPSCTTPEFATKQFMERHGDVAQGVTSRQRDRQARKVSSQTHE